MVDGFERVRRCVAKKKKGKRDGGPGGNVSADVLSLRIDSLSLSLSLSRSEHLSNETTRNKTENDYDSVN